MRKRQSIKKFAFIVAIAGLTGLTLCAIDEAFARGKQEAAFSPAKNFLPPVAVINDAMNIDQFEGKQTANAEDTLGPVVLSSISPASVKLSQRPALLKNNLNINKATGEMETLMGLQQKLDEKDLKYLWEATVEHNPVIRFSLEKLAIPIDLQPKHSSRFLNKTLAAMVNGAAMGAMMTLPGAGAYQNMGIATLSQATQNVLTGNNKPQQTPLTATEQIQLAGLIDDLKADLVQNYQGYKKTLEQLAQVRAISLRNNNLYATALKTDNPLSRMAAGSAYYKAMLNEMEFRQRATLYRLRLERLAGRDAVDQLQLALAMPSENQPQIASTTPAATTNKQVASSTTSKAPLSGLAPISELDSPIGPSEDESVIGPSPSSVSFATPSSANVKNNKIYTPAKPLGPKADTPLYKKASTKSPPVPLDPVMQPLEKL